MERLVIHLGLHKTGTTAVQDYLESNSSELLKRGAAYISLERMRREVTPLFYYPDDEKRDAAKRLFHSFPTRSLILSDENIAGGVDDIAEGALYPVARHKLTATIEAFTDLEIHVIVALRNPVELIPALYSEYLRFFDFVSFQTYVANFDVASASLWDTFGWIRSLPSNVTTHIIPYETRFGGGVPKVAATIVRAATGTSLGFDFRSLYEARARVSFTAEEIELATLVQNKSNGRVARLLLNSIDDAAARFGESRFSPIDGAMATRLSQRYEDDLAKFGIASAASE